jgi:hypothetical protein
MTKIQLVFTGFCTTGTGGTGASRGWLRPCAVPTGLVCLTGNNPEYLICAIMRYLWRAQQA